MFVRYNMFYHYKYIMFYQVLNNEGGGRRPKHIAENIVSLCGFVCTDCRFYNVNYFEKFSIWALYVV